MQWDEPDHSDGITNGIPFVDPPYPEMEGCMEYLHDITVVHQQRPFGTIDLTP